MAEIEKNDFNLNISRYISTAQAEVQIDLQAVNAQLREIEQKRMDAANQHNAFLRELGLAALPV
jgi:type I restriction enzyme M protein